MAPSIPLTFPSLAFLRFLNPTHIFSRISNPFGLQYRQKGHWAAPRWLCSGQRWPLWVGMSPAHVGPRGAPQAQDGGGSSAAAVPSAHRPLFGARVQPAGRQNQRYLDTDAGNHRDYNWEILENKHWKRRITGGNILKVNRVSIQKSM